MESSPPSSGQLHVVRRGTAAAAVHHRAPPFLSTERSRKGERAAVAVAQESQLKIVRGIVWRTSSFATATTSEAAGAAAGAAAHTKTPRRTFFTCKNGVPRWRPRLFSKTHRMPLFQDYQ